MKKSISIFCLVCLFLITSNLSAQTSSDAWQLYGQIKSGILVSEGSYFYAGYGLIGLKNSNLGVGAGTGFENYPNGSVIPFFADLRVFINDNNRISPFVFSELGYAIAKIENVDGWDKGGLMLKVGIGANLTLSSGITLLGEIAYQHQKSKAQFSKTYYSTTKGFYSVISLEDKNYNLVGVNIGIVIN
jgi:hypothetical protein